MTAFFQSQMDFIYFIYGLVFFVMAGVSYIMSRDRQQRLPWLWLVWFGFSHGTYEWLTMTGLAYGKMPLLAPLGSLILLASFICLFEFGRINLKRLTGWPIGPWLTVLLVGVSLLHFSAESWLGVGAVSRYLLGASGGLLAGWACWSNKRDLTRPERRSYLTLAVIFFLYAVSQVFIPQAQFFPANIISDAVFLRYFHFPVQFFRMLLAVGLFLAIWGLWLRSGEKGGGSHSRRKYSLFTSMIILLFTILSLGWLTTEYAGKVGLAGVDSDILDSARIAATALDLTSVSQLYGTPEDLDRAEYARIKDQLHQIDQATADFRYAYLLALRGGSIIFLADSEPADSPDYSPPGSIYSEAPPEAYQAFANGRDVVTKPYQDRRGDWVSGLVVLKDPGSGLAIALVGMDYQASRWLVDITKTRLAALGAIMIMVIILVGAFVFLQFSQETTRQIAMSEEKYRGLHDSLRDGLLNTDMQGNILECNQAYLDMLGYTKQEIVRLTYQQLTPAKWHALEADVVENKIIKTGYSGLYEKEYVKKDGTVFPVELAVWLIRDEQGGPAGMWGIFRDITERRKLEQEVDRQRENLATTLFSIGDGVIATDAQGRVTLVNPVAAKLIGWTMAEAEGRQVEEIFRIIFEDTRQYCPNPVKRVLESGEIIDLGNHVLLIDKKGREKPIEDSGAPIRDKSGKIIGIVLVFRDITGRRELEGHIKRLAQQDELILKAAGEGIIGLNKQGQIQFANPMALKLSGYTVEELNGRSVHEVFHLPCPSGSDHKDGNCPVFVALKEGAIYKGQDEIFWRKDGTSFTVEYISTPAWEREDIVGAVLVFNDITERRHAEEEIRNLSRALEQSPASVIITDTEGKIQYVNPRFIQLTGYELREVIGKNPRTLMSESILVEEDMKLWAMVRSGGQWRGEFQNRKKNGELYWALASITPIRDASGKIANFLAIEEDITARKHLEKVKDEFIGNVSHELRTPLSIVKESVSQISEGLHGSLTDQQRKYLGLTMEGINRLTRLIDNLLDMARIEAGKVELNCTKFDLAELIKEVTDQFQLLAQERGLAIKQLLPTEALPVQADRDRIIQVLTNLIGNSLKFTKKGQIEVAVADRGNEVECSVTDTGCGISDEDMPRVFNKFEQFGRTAGSGEKGTGLGLAISKSIIEAHHGRIGVESKLDQGTRVWFTLPK